VRVSLLAVRHRARLIVRHGEYGCVRVVESVRSVAGQSKVLCNPLIQWLSAAPQRMTQRRTERPL
jgi:hypothetical protein